VCAACLKHSLEVVIDLDTADDPLHSHQEGRFFHGFYGCYCYLPLFAFVGSIPLWAQLRTSEGDEARGAVDALGKIVAAVRKRTELANATAGTIRQRLLKIGALVAVSTRRVYVRLASAFPLQKLFVQVHRALAGLRPEDG
jgi:hypothetical protein